ncbi:hypothetical protein GG344DRAFT_69989 [Lentinula edodes]|nr:hypothetical protein GG344DRAFT_69989 [Lentinula edodes]
MTDDHANSAYISWFARWKAKAAAKTQAEQKRKVAERRRRVEPLKGSGFERVEGVESEAREKARFFWQAVIGLGPNLDQGSHEAQEVVIQAQITAQHIRPSLVSKLCWRGVGERGWKAQDNDCDDTDAEFDVDNGGQLVLVPAVEAPRVRLGYQVDIAEQIEHRPSSSLSPLSVESLPLPPTPPSESQSPDAGYFSCRRDNHHGQDESESGGGTTTTLINNSKNINPSSVVSSWFRWLNDDNGSFLQEFG